MDKCPDCNTPFKDWKPNRFVLDGAPQTPALVKIPNCSCFKKRADAQYQAHLQEEALKRAGERFERLLFDSAPIPDGVVVPHEGWSENFKAMVSEGNKFVIYGPTGTGKTAVLKTLAYRMCIADIKVRGGYMQWVLDSLKDLDHVGERMDWLLSGQVFILDDLDKPTMTKYEVDRLLSIVNFYDVPGRSLLASLNIDLPTLERKMTTTGGEEVRQKAAAIVSRLQNKAVLIKQRSDKQDRRSVAELGRD